MAFLDLIALRKRYGTIEVLKNINIELEEGGFLVLVGPSGCGKSTLLSTIAGLETITEGEIRLAGKVINDLHPSKRDIAMVFQSYALYPTMTVEANIGFGLEMRGVPKQERAKAVARVAETLQLTHVLKRKPSQLSGGQRQRVAMGRVLVRNPRLFLFDEPLSNLDAKLRVDMRIEIKRLHQETGRTVVYVTHDQIEAMTLATKIAVLKDGELQQVGTPHEIYNRPANLFVADFMGSPSMNLVRAAVVQRDGRKGLSISRRNGGGDLVLGIPPTITSTTLEEGRCLILGLRPEAITDRDSADRHARAIEFVDCAVEIVEPAGSDTFVVTHLADKEVVARMRSDADVRPGQTLSFAFNLDKAVVFDPESGQRLA
ncbi:multiple sugar transport system ATP-binding protein [Bradyrhizobium sp. LM2.7]